MGEERQEQPQQQLKKRTLRASLWSAVERFGVQGVSFLVMIVMARFLTPADYGMVGMLTIFIYVAQSLIDAGFSQGLIRKRDVSAEDTSTVFFFNIGASVALYALLWACAPAIARFYTMPELTVLTRVVSLIIIINSLTMVQRALMTINIDFKTQAKASLSGAVVAGATGIWMVTADFGVWAIVAYQLINAAVSAVLLWMMSKWRPRMLFSRQSFRELFTFGINIAFSTVIDTIYRNIYLLVIGKWFKASMLGYYTRAQHFGELPISLSSIIQRVSFPVLCGFKDDSAQLRHIMLRFLTSAAYVTFPVMAGMAAVADPLVTALLGERWAYAGTLLTILCLGMIWYPVSTINQNMLQVVGRSGLLLQMEVVKKILGVAIICVTLPFGMIPLVVGQTVNWMLIIVINIYYTRHVLPGLGFKVQIKALAPVILCSAAMALAAWAVTLPLDNSWLRLCAGVPTGIAVYIILSRLFMRTALADTLQLLRRR